MAEKVAVRMMQGGGNAALPSRVLDARPALRLIESIKPTKLDDPARLLTSMETGC
ncbi:hypothetical protein SNOG_16519 [Parastagonospora nodorum SN15]|uniref:Uncharacterized protein n=1 Tax=Phaeosphaeria nodorum (strain SN15 / ATCC MYA-4574 / FGSC 10173) TaxID=321614 RepID=Q0TVE5_PHANO|nr:hypothetical protein SNOG_16519 [Parastagonospora nodorum SN15]EAT76124.1 hypothetical protein SNOG_16519 [Parastagonospora nodorum SN15]